jgi:hypothetical protein
LALAAHAGREPGRFELASKITTAERHGEPAGNDTALRKG